MKNKKYIVLSIIVLIFALWFFPRIKSRVESNKVIDSNRSEEISQSSKLSYIKLNGKSRKVPDFIFKDQDNRYISNEDFRGKVYVAEFFLQLVHIFVLR